MEPTVLWVTAIGNPIRPLRVMRSQMRSLNSLGFDVSCWLQSRHSNAYLVGQVRVDVLKTLSNFEAANGIISHVELSWEP